MATVVATVAGVVAVVVVVVVAVVVELRLGGYGHDLAIDWALVASCYDVLCHVSACDP